MKRLLMFGLASAATLTAVVGLTLSPPAAADPTRLIEELELTETQQAELRTLFEERRDAVSEVLTEEQRAAVQAELESSGNFRDAMKAADLSEDQRDEVRTILEGSREEVSEILTDEQREELRSLMQERRGNRR